MATMVHGRRALLAGILVPLLLAATGLACVVTASPALAMPAAQPDHGCGSSDGEAGVCPHHEQMQPSATLTNSPPTLLAAAPIHATSASLPNDVAAVVDCYALARAAPAAQLTPLRI